MSFEKIEPELEKIASEVVGAAFNVHKAFGPGLLENAYEVCLVHDLIKRGIKVERQVAIPLVYDGEEVDVAFRVDILVEGKLLVELKAVERILPIHEAQIITYLKITGQRLGLLINFNVPLIKEGIKRIVL
jgi:GxxExxY protein